MWFYVFGSTTDIDISGLLSLHYYDDLSPHVLMGKISNMLFVCGTYVNLRINLNPPHI